MASPRGRAKGKRAASAVRYLPEDDSFFGRAADWVLMNPVRSGGILVILLTTIAIVSNAVFFQSSPHPSPFFATRPEAVPAAPVVVPKTAPIPKSRGDAVEPSMVRSEKLTGASSAGDAETDSVAVIAIQDALAERGIYDGKADGKLGAKTRAAIAAYEKKYGLPETGMPSDGLMAHLRRTENGDAKPAAPSGNRDNQIAEVQSALNSIGYGPIQVTGSMSAETADSIRRFELDNGMAISGEASPAIVRKLVAIGAINQN